MPISYTVLVNKKPFTFTSKCTDTQAIAKLKSLIESGQVTDDFAKKLLATKKPTEKQVAWIHKYVFDSNNKPVNNSSSAIDVLKALIGNKKLKSKSEEDFALDLVCQSRSKQLTDKQLEWVHKLADTKTSAGTMPDKLRNPESNRMVVVTYERALKISKMDSIPAEWNAVIQKYKSIGRKF
jgi:hypothetical protein